MSDETFFFLLLLLLAACGCFSGHFCHKINKPQEERKKTEGQKYTCRNVNELQISNDKIFIEFTIFLDFFHRPVFKKHDVSETGSVSVLS
jgi:hypothetical protein